MSEIGKRIVSQSRTYVACCLNLNSDGYYFKSFLLPEEYENNAYEAADYYLWELDGGAHLTEIFSMEDYLNITPETKVNFCY